MVISSEHIEQLFTAFNKMRVLIIGDVMIDAYTEGIVERMSPEAPVPVLSVRKRYNRLGGAANVALNIKSLGAEPLICSVIGDDTKGEKFMQLLRRHSLDTKNIIKSSSRTTTLKERMICDGKQMMRVDEEDIFDLNETETEKILATLRRTLDLKKIDCIILQDYNKGVLTETIIKEIIATAKMRTIPVVVDPKKKNFLAYQGVTLFKPNAKELREGLSVTANETSEIEAAAAKLREMLQCDMVMTTMSDKGVIIKGKDPDFHHIPAHQRDIKDVSGAGDTVLSVAALCVVANESPFNIAAISNIAGGLVCEKIGVVPIDRDMLLSEAKIIYAQNA